MLGGPHVILQGSEGSSTVHDIVAGTGITLTPAAGDLNTGNVTIAATAAPVHSLIAGAGITLTPVAGDLNTGNVTIGATAAGAGGYLFLPNLSTTLPTPSALLVPTWRTPVKSTGSTVVLATGDQTITIKVAGIYSLDFHFTAHLVTPILAKTVIPVYITLVFPTTSIYTDTFPTMQSGQTFYFTTAPTVAVPMHLNFSCVVKCIPLSFYATLVSTGGPTAKIGVTEGWAAVQRLA